MIKKLVLLVCFFVLITGISFATRISREEKTCPLCGTKFMAAIVWSTNNFGGTDHDLCPHAMGSSPLSSYIWGCPYCNFCGFSDDFSKSYTDEEKNKILNWLKENYPPTIEKPDQDASKKKSDEEEFEEQAYRRSNLKYDSLPSYKRYEIAAELAKLANESNYEIGKLYLRSAWCARANTTIAEDNKDSDNYEISRLIDSRNSIIDEEAMNIEKNLDRSELVGFTMADFYIKIANNIEKREISDEKEKLSCYCALAAQLRSSGENTKAEIFMKKAEQCKDSDKVSGLFKGLRNSIKIERKYQSKVIEYLSASLNDDLDPNQQLEVTLLLGEMNRRLEKYDEAKKYYSKLLEKPESLPEQFMRTVKFATEAMGIKDNKQQEAFDKIEENRIYSYLKKLSSPHAGREAAMVLHLSQRRDIIYPKLVEIINKAIKEGPDTSKIIKKDGMTMLVDEEAGRVIIMGDEPNKLPNVTLEHAIMAMSDETEEAAKFLYDLLDKDLEERDILRNLKHIAQYLPSEKFIQRFNNATSSYEIQEYAEFLKIIGDKPSFEALMAKAEKVLNDEGLKNLVLKEYPEKNREACYSIVESLAFFRGKRTVDFLVNLCERIKNVYKEIKEKHIDKNIHCSELLDLYKKAGCSLEIMFFRHFGFDWVPNRKLEPKKLEQLTNSVKFVEEPLIAFKEWYAKHGNENYKNIIYEGFKKYGYDILPVSDPKKLYLLVEGFEDGFDAARVQCYKELVRRTGIKKRPDAGLEHDFLRGDDRQILISFYTKWLDENISKLVYDEKAMKFIIKK